MNGLHPAIVDLVRRLPKAELHCHLDGSLQASTLLELSAAEGIVLPATNAPELAQWMRVDDARNLSDYLARFEITLAVMQDAASLERIAHELVVDAARDGVRHIEVRFCPALNVRRALSLDDVMAAVWKGLERGHAQSGTSARIIVCALRSFASPHAMVMAELAVANRHRGVVGFDLAGGEFGNPAHEHARAFDFARANDLAVTVHAGEGAGADSIRDAVHRCGADRIGHGTRLFEDPALEAYVVDHQIPLEICPTSNVQTRVVPTFAEHPLMRYRQLGAVVTLNTDNRMMSGVSLTEEYTRCVEHLGMDFNALTSIALASFDALFLPLAERLALRFSAAQTIESLLHEWQSVMGREHVTATGSAT